MAKLIVLASLLAALLAISTENIGLRGGCERELSKQDGLNMCAFFLRERTQHGSNASYYFYKLASVTWKENPQRERYRKECCRQLENVREDCRCDGLTMALEHDRHGEKEMQEMIREAENLPSTCGIGPRCHFKIETAT